MGFHLSSPLLGSGREGTGQPYYVIDTNRPSTLIELKTMHQIRLGIAQKDTQAACLLRPARVVLVHDILPDAEISARFHRLLSHSHLGGQYDWLARLASQENVENLELCIHIDDKAHGFIAQYVEEAEGNSWRLKSDLPDPDLSLFSRFHFPILQITKVEMENIARREGLLELMQKTWFCQTPRNNQPCGLCNPCRYTIEEGMAHRLPKSAQWRHATRGLRALREKLKGLLREGGSKG